MHLNTLVVILFMFFFVNTVRGEVFMTLVSDDDDLGSIPALDP